MTGQGIPMIEMTETVGRLMRPIIITLHGGLMCHYSEEMSFIAFLPALHYSVYMAYLLPAPPPNHSQCARQWQYNGTGLVPRWHGYRLACGRRPCMGLFD